MPDGLALYYDPLFLAHETPDHPERGERVVACIELLEASGLIDRLERPQSRDATEDEIALVHSRGHIERMKRAVANAPIWVDPDTFMSAGSYAAAVRAAGACLAATEAVLRGEFGAAFCLTRPPGHHAVPDGAMGFCFFNNVAIAARAAVKALGTERIAIVDIDIHHGNGSQDAFYEDPSVLYVSTHQYPFYPGTGHWSEAGRGAGAGLTLNLSLPGGCGDPEYARAFDEVIAPKLRAFRPQVVLVSAGFDAHYADPISGALMRLSCAGYASMIGKLRALADELCDGRIVVALEGGYDLTALPWSVRNSIEALKGETLTPDPLGPAPAAALTPDIGPLLTAVRELHALK